MDEAAGSDYSNTAYLAGLEGIEINAVALGRVYLSELTHICEGLRECVDLAYLDIIYDDPRWHEILYIIKTLRPGGALFLQTDYRSVAQCKLFLDERLEFVNWIIWPYDWGGRPRNAFGRKHDDILYYCKPGGERVFNAGAVSVKKKTRINSTKTEKIPTDVWDDIGNFHTMSKERIKGKNGRGVVWQKPERLLERVILCASNPGDVVFEPYGGTGTACSVAKRLGRQWVGCDINPEMHRLACERLGKK